MGLAMTLKRLRQQMHKGRGQQRASRQTQQTLRHYAGRAPSAQAHQQSSHPDTTDTGSQGGQNNCYQCHSYIWLNRSLLTGETRGFSQNVPAYAALLCDLHTNSPGCTPNTCITRQSFHLSKAVKPPTRKKRNSSHAVLFEPGQHALPAIAGGLLTVACAVVGVKSMGRIRVDHKLRGLGRCRA